MKNCFAERKQAVKKPKTPKTKTKTKSNKVYYSDYSVSGTFLRKIISLWKNRVPSVSPIILTSMLQQLRQKPAGQIQPYHIKFAFCQWLREIICLWLEPCRRQQQYDCYCLEKSILSGIVRGPWLWHQNTKALQAIPAVLAVCSGEPGQHLTNGEKQQAPLHCTTHCSNALQIATWWNLTVMECPGKCTTG